MDGCAMLQIGRPLHRRGGECEVGTNASSIFRFVQLSRSGVWASEVMHLMACLFSVKGSAGRLSRSGEVHCSAATFVGLMSSTSAEKMQ